MSDIYKTVLSGKWLLKSVFELNFFVKLGDWRHDVAKNTHHLWTICLNVRPKSLSFILLGLLSILSLARKEGLALEFGGALFLRTNNGIPC